MNAGPVLGRREGLLAEVTGLELREEVVSADLAPAHEILGRDQDPSVVAGPTARAAGEAIEL